MYLTLQGHIISSQIDLKKQTNEQISTLAKKSDVL